LGIRLIVGYRFIGIVFWWNTFLSISPEIDTDFCGEFEDDKLHPDTTKVNTINIIILLLTIETSFGKFILLWGCWCAGAGGSAYPSVVMHFASIY